MKAMNASVSHKKLITESMKKRKVDMTKEKANKKNSGAPKRPATAFFVFMEDFRKTYKENFPDNKSVAAVTKAGGQRWSSMSESEKLPYVSKASKRKQEYDKAVEEFNKNINAKVEAGKPEGSDKSSCEEADAAEQEASS